MPNQKSEIPATIEPSRMMPLQTSATWQTQARGSNCNEYQIYVGAALSLGWDVKSFDEWLNS